MVSHRPPFGAVPKVYKLQACLSCFVKRKDKFPKGTYDEDYTQIVPPNDDPMAWGSEEEFPDLQVGRLD